MYRLLLSYWEDLRWVVVGSKNRHCVLVDINGAGYSFMLIPSYPPANIIHMYVNWDKERFMYNVCQQCGYEASCWVVVSIYLAIVLS